MINVKINLKCGRVLDLNVNDDDGSVQDIFTQFKDKNYYSDYGIMIDFHDVSFITYDHEEEK